MFGRHLVQRTVGVSAGAAAMALFLTTPAHAAGAKEKSACTAAYTAYKSAIDAEKAGHLREARETLRTCAEATACAGLAPKCAAKYTQLGADMPSIVPIVADDTGTPRADVEVRMDGQMLTSKLDGKGIPVEPGLHELTFSADGKVVGTQKVLVVEGQRNRTVSVVIGGGEKSSPKATAGASPAANDAPRSAQASAPEDTSPGKGDDAEGPVSSPAEKAAPGRFAMPHSALPYVLAGVGVAAVGAGALLTFWGKKDNDQMGADCGQTQTCLQSSVDHVKTLYIASDISVGAGVVALGVATWLFASSRSTEEKPAPRSAYVFDVQPTRTGAVASVSGAF